MTATSRPVRYGSIIILILLPITLFLAQTSFWINHTVFNQESFTRITTASLLAESSRDAIASSVVDKALEDRPIAKRLIGGRVESLVSGLLNSDLSNQAITSLSKKTYSYATSSDRQDIKIDLAGIKTPINSIISLVQNYTNAGDSVPNTSQIPDEIVLVKKDTFPDLSQAVQAMLWLGPILWLSVIALASGYIYLGRSNYAKRVYNLGITFVGVGIFGLFTSPFIPPSIAAVIPTIELRPVAQNLSANFLEPFSTQMYWMIGTTLIVLLIFSQRFRIAGAAKTVAAKISSSTDTKKS